MIQNKVSIYQAIDMARRGLEIEQLGPIMSTFIEWVWDGEKKIGSSVTFTRKECLIDIDENGVGCLPKDVLYILAIGKTGMKMEQSTTDFQLFEKKLVNNNSGFAMTSSASASQYLDALYGFFINSPMKFSVHNGKIYMAGYKSGQISIAYKGVCLDDEGYPLVNELHIEALAAFLIYMHTQTEYLRARAPKYLHDDMKLRWLELCLQARSEDEMPNPLDLRILNGIWNNMLPLGELNNF
jgi:hypothetical protein